ncbi:acetyl-CoA carboxylase biotin carboxylase subunit [Kordiimonas marina]|uniref:acetyl-CoA carboxylase biotin carboxylase subunit n=1 Tax=Kordiimonas marina TaxID=2872312 RepID=UPI001FF25ECE|nr:acetyl/propionyl/methylcrotonyl-CoA carboxylase subunit alpha [Kordiimonas marina]MCJ9429051.1 acetyl/propionyl/methylcrotonyl-CoA carboxylase subunit alpha [Kordiimonas marina]
MTHRIRKLLIANRGEIACRVMATCERLGIKTVAVYSDADRDALHVAMADEAVHIGPAPARESYLVAEKIIDACKRTGADAVHPGYGFLSENPAFAEACQKAGIIFVGPSAQSMRAMALKGAAKALMEDAGVPVVPGYHGDDQSLETLVAEAELIGFPVLIKAVAGGGGKGMRKVYSLEELPSAIEGARREGENSFGDGTLLIEKLIEKPRHIEMQVFGDVNGTAVHLFERDCSLQRRHQKVIEEAPAPGMSAEMRRAMGDAAVKAAEAIGYVGAGTVEFIVDVANGIDGAPFYFMEMNTRLQVEHPVTEAITGQDLVEWQIMVAEGKDLPLAQDEIEMMADGHAVEVRLYAEDPYGGFLPATGKIGLFDPFANVGAGQRIDAGVRAGDAVSIHYDPMIAKLIAWGEDRESAINALIDLVENTPVSGLTTNRDFLISALKDKDFRAGDVHTGFIEAHKNTLLTKPAVSAHDYALASAAILAARHTRIEGTDPWAMADNFRLNLAHSEKLWFENEDGEVITATVAACNSTVTITVADATVDARIIDFDGDTLTLEVDGLRSRLFAEVDEAKVTLVTPERTMVIKRHARDGGLDDEVEGPGTITAPMPGKILDVKVTDGETVEKGQPLLIMEAMKMEQTITAPKAGTVSGLALTPGQQVTGGAVLLTIQDKE